MSAISFFFNDTATTEIYTLSLHDALPIWALATLKKSLATQLRAALIQKGFSQSALAREMGGARTNIARILAAEPTSVNLRSEEHTSELQSRQYLVCRLLLEKKKQ